MALISIKRHFESKIFLRPFFMEDPGKNATEEQRVAYTRWLTTGVTMPIRVARMTRNVLEEIDDGWNRLCEPPRGSNEEAREAWATQIKNDQYSYLKDVVEKHVTLDAGLIDIDGVDVIDGEGLVRAFHSRLDVLGALVTAVRSENRLGPTIAKNSKSLFDSATGLAPLTQEEATAAGSIPERTATNAESSNSAPAVDATGKKSGDSADGSKSSHSGEAGEQVH